MVLSSHEKFKKHSSLTVDKQTLKIGFKKGLIFMKETMIFFFLIFFLKSSKCKTEFRKH